MLDEIYESYRLVQGWFSSKEEQDGYGGESSWERLRELNDYAYFVLLFGQLEDHVNWAFKQVKGDEEGSFRHRANVLYGRSTITEMIGDYYSIRCDIAHGYAEEGRLMKLEGDDTIENLYRNICEIIDIQV